MNQFELYVYDVDLKEEFLIYANNSAVSPVTVDLTSIFYGGLLRQGCYFRLYATDNAAPVGGCDYTITINLKGFLIEPPV